MLIKVLALFTKNYLITALIISNAAILMAAFFLYKLCRHDGLEENTALTSVLYLFVFPTAFVFSGAFTESIFLLFSLLSIYFARKKQWALAGMFGAFSTLTRFVGAALFLALAIEYLHQKKWKYLEIKKDFLWLLLIPLALVLFSWFTYVKTGDPLTYLTAHQTFGRKFINPLEAVTKGLAMFSLSKANLFFAALCAAFGLLVVGLGKIPWSYKIYGLFLILIPLSTGLDAMPRYLLPIFPIYIVLAKVLSKRPNYHNAVIITFAIAQGALMSWWSINVPMFP